MTRKQHGIGLATAVAAGCLALLVLLVALATRSSGGGAGSGFPLVLAGLLVVAALLALGWRAVHRKPHSRL